MGTKFFAETPPDRYEPKWLKTVFDRLVSVLGSVVSGSAWGTITGTLADQTDLNSVLSGKEASIGTKNTAFNKNYGTTTTDVKVNGTQGVGSVDAVARIDHVHPVDTSRQAAGNELTALQALADTAGFLKKTGDGAYAIDTETYRRSAYNRSVLIENDFYSTTAFSALAGSALSSGSISTSAGEPNHPGVVTLLDSTTANGGYKLTTYSSSIRLAGTERGEFVFKFGTLRSGLIVNLGFFDTTTAADSTDLVCLHFTGATGRLTGGTRADATFGTTATYYSPTAGVWYRGVVELNSNATLATFTLYAENGSVLWTDTLSSYIPTASGRELGFGVIATESTTDTAAIMLYLDYASMSISRTLTR